MTERKLYRATIELKGDEDEGSFSATIATFGVVDLQGDVTFAGAFPVGKEIPISAYGHSSWRGELPVGKGVIGADSRRAWVTGRFFTDTSGGRDTYRTVKRLGSLMEWSYGFDVKDAIVAPDERLDRWPEARRGLVRLDVFEASPVLVGAGIGTGTDFVKCDRCMGADPARADVAAIAARNAARLAALTATDPDLRAAMNSARKRHERIRAELGEETQPNTTDHSLATEACAFAAKHLGGVIPAVKWFIGERSLLGYAIGREVWLNVARGAAATSRTELVETVCHEVVHVLEPHRPHDDVARLAKTISALFWDKLNNPVSKEPVYARSNSWRMSVGGH